MRLLLLIAILIAGCASTPEGDINAARSSWQGASYDDVVRSWGAPAHSTKLADGTDAHTWVSESIAPRASFWPSIGIFGGSGGVGIGTGVTMGPGGGELVRCERTLMFRQGRVADQTWNGPQDYCSSFRRG
jgi:hypothetical protein